VALSTTRKVAIAGMVIGRAAARHRYAKAAWSAASAVGRTLWRTLYRLWLEISAFFFLVFAALGGFAAYREYPSLQSGDRNLVRMAVICAFTLVFLWFGLSSLWRARRSAAAREKSAPRHQNHR
jgi:hypothetical protein